MIDPFIVLAPVLVLPIVGLLRFIGCTTFTSTDEPSAPATPVSVTVTPNPVTVCQGQPVTFTAAVANSSDTAITTWTASDGQSLTVTSDPQPGAPAGTPPLNNHATYTPPNPPGPSPVTITATSHADPTKNGTATVNVQAFSATFAPEDRVTSGDWTGPYGHKGWVMAGDPKKPGNSPANLIHLPPYLPSVNVGMLNLIPSWPDPDMTNNAVSLVKPPIPSTTRFDAAWIDPSAVDITLAFNDCDPHPVTLRLIDWGNEQRDQTVEILDVSHVPPQVLATHHITAFAAGLYLTCTMRGTVLVRVIANTLPTGSKPTAVLTALFFD
jgi:hypothetical protein